jgi:hypothetical protein
VGNAEAARQRASHPSDLPNKLFFTVTKLPGGALGAVRRRSDDVGIGFCQQAGQATDDVCYVVVVQKKKPISELTPDDVGPAVHAGAEVDVIEQLRRMKPIWRAEKSVARHEVGGGGTVYL